MKDSPITRLIDIGPSERLQDKKPVLGDFLPEKQTTRRINFTPTTASMVAASEAVLSGQADEGAYKNIRDGLLDPESREKFLLEIESRRNLLYEGLLTTEAPQLLMDTTLTDEEKGQMIEGLREEAVDNSTVRQLLESSVVKTKQEEEETVRDSESKDVALEWLDVIHQQKKDFSNKINALSVERNQKLAGNVVDIVENYMIPFSEWVNVNQMAEALNEGDGAYLPGTIKKQLFSAIAKVPVDKRPEFFESVVEMLQNHGDVILPDGNHLVMMETLEKMFINNDYDNTDVFVDNVFGVLDVVGVFALVRGLAKGPKAASALAKVRKTTTVDGSNPSAPAKVLAQTDAESARAAHEAVAASTGDEVAEGAYGTTRSDALASDTLPSPEVSPGEVPHKVMQKDDIAPEPEEIRLMRSIDASSALTDTEIARVRERVVASFDEINGMTHHANQMVFKRNEDGSTTYNLMFRPKDSGLRSYDEAMENALFSFRGYGSLEENITIYARRGDKWVATTREEEVGLEAIRAEARKKRKKIPTEARQTEYAVGLNYTYRFSPEDLTAAEILDRDKVLGFIPLNFLNRLGIGKGGREGSFTEHLFDANSLMNKQFTHSAAAATDRGFRLQKLYVDEFREFAHSYAAMKADRREKMIKYIHEANDKGLKLSTKDLYKRGFDDDEVDMLKQWRKANDTLYHATNADLIKTLRNKGFKMFVDKTTDTKLVGKAIPRNGMSPGKSYYNLTTGKVEKAAANKAELDAFYESGGTFVRLQEPVKVGDDWVDIVRSSEASGQSYLRAFNPHDRVLAYRQSYYPVMYDANHYVQIRFKVDGKDVTKTVASSRSRESADKYVRDLQRDYASKGENVEVIRVDDARLSTNTADSISEDGFAVGVSSGMSAQRLRGKRLKDLDSDLYKGEYTNLIDPMDAVAAQIQQLSAKSSMRDWLETTKRRWMQNYGEKLGLKDGKYPSSVQALQKTANISEQELADAIDLFNYVRKMEDGYANTFDEILKAGFNMVGNSLGKGGFVKLEAATKEMAKGSVSGGLRGTTFKLYLASAPLRQLLIQGHQAIQLQALEPAYFYSGLLPDMMEVSKAALGMKASDEAVTMLKELRRSGFLEAVDSNAFVRKDVLRLADATWARKATRVGGLPLQGLQMVGFDAAENFVLRTAWMTFYRRAQKAGLDVTDRRVLDQIVGEARSFTYNMNKSGEVPYNRNSLSVVGQFLSVPHKAFLQQFANTSLTRAERARLLTFNTVMYGIPAWAGAQWLQENIEDPVLRETLTKGFEHVVLNKTLTELSGEETNIDWGDLAPSNITGMADTLTNLMTMDLGNLVLEAPATSLILGGNPRLMEAFKTAAKYTNLREDYDDPELETTFDDVLRATGSMFSGYSHMFRGMYALKAQEMRSTLGDITDSDLSVPEQFAQFFGLSTVESKASYTIYEKLREAQADATGRGKQNRPYDKGDVRSWYEELKRQLNRRSIDNRQRDFSQRVLAEGFRVFNEDKPYFREQLLSLIEQDNRKGNYDYLNGIIRSVGIIDENELRGIIRDIPDPTLRGQMEQWLEVMNE